MSDAKFASLGALGAGLLTGTALAVILPEGFHAFQAARAAAGVAHLFAFPSRDSQQPCTEGLMANHTGCFHAFCPPTS